jgi:hypothetical protein
MAYQGLTYGCSSAEAAEQFDLPLEAVLEAVDYYQRHKDWVDARRKKDNACVHGYGILALCGRDHRH